MPANMKKMIAEAAHTLLTEKKVKKLTVKDIVEECHITRQSFYYHFEDIPDLLHWILEQETEQMIQEARGRQKAEEGLRYFFRMAVTAAPYVRKTIHSHYGEEIERLLQQQICRLLALGIEETGLYRGCSLRERELVVRYHSQAVIGILHGWTEEDTQNLDQIVHVVYCMITGQPVPSDREANHHH